MLHHIVQFRVCTNYRDNYLCVHINPRDKHTLTLRYTLDHLIFFIALEIAIHGLAEVRNSCQQLPQDFARSLW